MRRALSLGLVIALVGASASPVAAKLVSKSYVFKKGVTLEVGGDVGEGLRLDSVRFFTPQGLGSRLVRPSGSVRVDVTVSNLGSEAKRFGIAIALFDQHDRLVGVSSGGSNFLALKPERQATYSLLFKDVKGHALDAATFKISIETRL